jgi:hypothetical protein
VVYNFKMFISEWVIQLFGSKFMKVKTYNTHTHTHTHTHIHTHTQTHNTHTNTVKTVFGEHGQRWTYISERVFRCKILDICTKGKVHPCTGTEALYRPYGP